MVLQRCPQLDQNGQAFILQQQSVTDYGPPWEGECSSWLPATKAVPEGIHSCGLSTHCILSSWGNKLSRKGHLGGTSEYLPHYAKYLEIYLAKKF